MTTLSILFWLSIAILFYCYVGYGFVAWIVNFFRVSSGNRVTSFERLPVTLVVTAFNEASLLGEKIRNSLMLQYPSELLEIIFITDGSRDGSTEIVNEYSQIRLLHQPERLGKYAAIKRAMRHVRTPIVVFSDANTLLNPESIEEIVKHYQDPSIGGVAGEKKIVDGSPIGAGEGLYWQYESYMKKLDADLYTVMGAAGELFSIRTELFQELDDNVILDDFVMSMQICLQGYRIAYEPGAYATELPSASLIEETRRKIRISAGAYQSIGYLTKCLDFINYPLLSFQYISRRLWRWTLCPFLILVATISNIVIVLQQPSPLFMGLLAAQVAFYAGALVGWILVATGRRAGLFTIPFYFLFMNYCLVRGCFRFLAGKQTVLWEKSLREVGTR